MTTSGILKRISNAIRWRLFWLSFLLMYTFCPDKKALRLLLGLSVVGYRNMMMETESHAE